MGKAGFAVYVSKQTGRDCPQSLGYIWKSCSDGHNRYVAKCVNTNDMAVDLVVERIAYPRSRVTALKAMCS